MKKALTILALAMLVATQAFATYVVVLKDGTRYKAKAKWTVVNGKALVALENGQTLQLDPALIDAAKSEQATKMGLSNGNVLDLTPNMGQPAQQKPQEPSLGSQIKLRKLPPAQKPGETAPAPKTTAAPAPAIAPAQIPTGSGTLPQEVVDKFQRAFENVGIFEQKVTPTSARSLRAELTADSEDKVFNAISAASFLMVRNAGVSGAQLDLVELYMKTTNGGAAGRFQMTRQDAEALDKRTISQQDYFVRKVLY